MRSAGNSFDPSRPAHDKLYVPGTFVMKLRKKFSCEPAHVLRGLLQVVRCCASFVAEPTKLSSRLPARGHTRLRAVPAAPDQRQTSVALVVGELEKLHAMGTTLSDPGLGYSGRGIAAQKPAPCCNRRPKSPLARSAVSMGSSEDNGLQATMGGTRPFHPIRG